MPRLSSARLSALIPLGFAVWWLWMGLTGFAPATRLVVGIAGTTTLAAIALLAFSRARPPSARVRFGRRYFLVVAGEVAALVVAVNWLSVNGRMDLMMPVIGIVVGLHFVGLYWATPVKRLLWLGGAMTAVSASALLLADPRPLSGLGSALLLGLSVAI